MEPPDQRLKLASETKYGCRWTVSEPASAGAGGVFGDPFCLTLAGELVRRQVAQRAVWTTLAVVVPPRFDPAA
jgi:hypothetical protein